jgi:protein required for attachment to host cells
MDLPKGAIIAVADGEKLNLFINDGENGTLKLTAFDSPKIEEINAGSGNRHSSSSANPADSQQDEDGFAVGIADILNKHALGGKTDKVVVVAAPRTLGELRKHYHKTLVALLAGEIAKDLTNHSTAEIEKAITAA